MSITVLPSDTQKLLGSTSFITTPLSLVKELVDNAIDASASNVEIIVSQNTVDKIEVRDNGLGIHADDYDSLGRFGHTSKLKNFDDLHQIVGKSLGFRGVALASANTMGKVTITTKTSSEPVAAILQLNPSAGGVLNQQSGSAPVGTTVSVSEIYHGIPVRRQCVLSEAKNALDKIKRLLWSYALARPTIKLTLKVIGNAALNWHYSPVSNASPCEAILQIFGKDVASRCTEKTYTLPAWTEKHMNALDIECNILQQPFELQASMWKADAECMRAAKHRFFSVDARPVISTKGTVQKLASLYTKYLSNAMCALPHAKPICDAFIRLDIKCPPGAYDINIEPLKDGVLFEDEHTVIQGFKSLCEDMYGPLDLADHQSVTEFQLHSCSPSFHETAQIKSNVTKKETKDRSKDDQEHIVHHTNPGVELLSIEGCEFVTTAKEQQKLSSDPLLPQTSLFYTRPSSQFRSVLTTINAPVSTGQHVNSLFRSQHDNNLNDKEMVDIPPVLSEVTGNLYGQTHRNYKQNHDTYHQHKAQGPDMLQDKDNPLERSLATPASGAVYKFDDAKRNHDDQSSQLPSQSALRAISMTTEPALLRHRGAPPRDLDIPPSMSHPQYHEDGSCLSNSVSDRAYKSQISSPLGINSRKPRVSLRRRDQPPWTPPSSVQKDQGQWQRRYGLKSQMLSGGSKQTTISFGGSQHQRKVLNTHKGEAFTYRDNPLDDTTCLQPPSANTSGHEMIAENFSSKRGSIARLNIVRLGGTHPQNVAQQNTSSQVYPIAIEPNRLSALTKKPIVTSLPTGDPRAYLLRRQKSIATDNGLNRPNKFRRMKSVLLPFENISKEHQTREISLTLNIDMESLPDILASVEKYDRYILEGDIVEALDMDICEGYYVEERLNSLLSAWSGHLGERRITESNLMSTLGGQGIEVIM